MKAGRDVHSCYLCGDALSKPTNRDHVPPRQLFGPSIRKRYKLQLDVLEVHKSCNQSFSSDEEYFFQLLMPFASGSEAGNAVRIKAVSDYRAGKRMPLVDQILASVEYTSANILLPTGKIALSIDSDRVRRVLWKLVRGLYFLESRMVLPPSHPIVYEITPPGEIPPVHFQELNYFFGHDSGRYPGAFSYWKHSIRGEAWIDYWALLIWDRIIITVFYHVPKCPCGDCVGTSQSTATD